MIKYWRHDGVNYLQPLLTSPRPRAIMTIMTGRLGAGMRRGPWQLGHWVETGELSGSCDVARGQG